MQVDYSTITAHLYDRQATVTLYECENKWYIVIKQYPDRDKIYLSLCTAPLASIAEHDFFSIIDRILTNYAKKQVIWGQDDSHVYYGIPFVVADRWDEQTINKWGWRYDIDLFDMQIDTNKHSAMDEHPYAIQAYSPKYSNEFKLFLEREFPGRWYHTMTDTMKSPDAEQDIVLLLDPRHDFLIEGFARITDYTSTVKGSASLFTKNKDQIALGPIGIAKKNRSKGLGSILLQDCIRRSKKRHGELLIADWVKSLDFYTKHGFEIRDRFISMHRAPQENS